MADGLPFVKMHGLGNDFVVIEGTHPAAVGEASALARRVCDRRRSVGADGLLLVSAPDAAAGAVRVRYLNRDGSEAFCGNGARCAARFARLRGWVGDRMTLDTAAGPIRAEVDGDLVVIELSVPIDRGARRWTIGEAVHEGRLIDAGCPHAVLMCEDVDRFPLHVVGPELRAHPDLAPDGANVTVHDPRGRMRTWERGVEGETLACGSGALAVARLLFERTGTRRVTIATRGGGELTVDLLGDGGALDAAALRGAAVVAFHGRLPIDGRQFP